MNYRHPRREEANAASRPASESPVAQKIKNLVTTAPVTAGVVERFIAGETSDEVVTVTRRLVGAGLLVSIDYLGEDTIDRSHADAVVVAYLDLLTKLRESGLSASAEVSIKLTAMGHISGMARSSRWRTPS